MPQQSRKLLLFGGGGSLGPALARRFRAEGVELAMVARHAVALDALARDIGAKTYSGDVGQVDDVRRVFEMFRADFGGDPDIVIHNAHRLVMGPILELDAATVAAALQVNALGAFLVGQEAARRMVASGTGTIIFTGATASLRGSAGFGAFAMGKAGARMVAQSLAREIGPRGVHVAHVVIDGGIEGAPHVDRAGDPDSTISPAAIAETYLYLVNQPRSAWTHEIDLRPWSERF